MYRGKNELRTVIGLYMLNYLDPTVAKLKKKFTLKYMVIRNIWILDEITYIKSDIIYFYVDSREGCTFTVSIATTKHVLQRMNE